MIKTTQDENLARQLHKHITSEDTLKSAMFIILNIDCENHLNAKRNEIQKQFKGLYLNKMLGINTDKLEKSVDCLHTPKINSCSIKLAERSREKRKQLVQGFTNPMLADILVATKKAQQKQNSLKKSFKAAQELKECTFHPTVSNGGQTTKRKGFSLSNLTKDIKKMKGRTKEDIEYERSKDELTFAPIIHKYTLIIIIDSINQLLKLIPHLLIKVLKQL